MTESMAPANAEYAGGLLEPRRIRFGLFRLLAVLGARPSRWRPDTVLAGFEPCAAPDAGFTFRARLAHAAHANDDAPPRRR